MMRDLDSLSQELVERIAREKARSPETDGTHVVGGITKVGVQLQSVLRVLICEVASRAGRDPIDFMPQLGHRRVSVSRATIGQLVTGLGAARASGLPMDSATRVLLADLDRRPSVLRDFLQLRNDVAHEGRVAADAAHTLDRLSALVAEYRRTAGFALVAS